MYNYNVIFIAMIVNLKYTVFNSSKIIEHSFYCMVSVPNNVLLLSYLLFALSIRGFTNNYLYSYVDK